MFDPKKAALLILGHGKDEGEEAPADEGPSGADALSAAFDLLKAGKKVEAYDAFRAAVESCGAEPEGEMDKDPAADAGY